MTDRLEREIEAARQALRDSVQLEGDEWLTAHNAAVLRLIELGVGSDKPLVDDTPAKPGEAMH